MVTFYVEPYNQLGWLGRMEYKHTAGPGFREPGPAYRLRPLSTKNNGT